MRDSKKLTRLQREACSAKIRSVAEAIGLGAASPREIDALGIREATALAMRRALRQIGPVDHLLVDGSDGFDLGIPSTSIIRGDDSSLSIASASIIAKVTRDLLMQRLDRFHPQYGWGSNKGYGSAAHLAAVREHGLSAHHRRTFCVRPQIELAL